MSTPTEQTVVVEAIDEELIDKHIPPVARGGIRFTLRREIKIGN